MRWHLISHNINKIWQKHKLLYFSTWHELSLNFWHGRRTYVSICSQFILGFSCFHWVTVRLHRCLTFLPLWLTETEENLKLRDRFEKVFKILTTPSQRKLKTFGNFLRLFGKFCAKLLHNLSPLDAARWHSSRPWNKTVQRKTPVNISTAGRIRSACWKSNCGGIRATQTKCG